MGQALLPLQSKHLVPRGTSVCPSSLSLVQDTACCLGWCSNTDQPKGQSSEPPFPADTGSSGHTSWHDLLAKLHNRRCGSEQSRVLPADNGRWFWWASLGCLRCGLAVCDTRALLCCCQRAMGWGMQVSPCHARGWRAQHRMGCAFRGDEHSALGAWLP